MIGRLNELRKSLYAPLAVLVAVAISWASTGALNRVELAAGTVALIHAVVAWAVTNWPQLANLKAYAALGASAIYIGSQWIETGTFNKSEIVALGAALLLALVTGVAPNGGRTNSLGSLPGPPQSP